MIHEPDMPSSEAPDEPVAIRVIKPEAIPVSLPRLGRLGTDQTNWLMCLNAAATIAAAHNHSIARDPTTIDPIALADRFYAALQARSFSAQAK